jgi:preprotein translocase subunit SecB
LTELSLKANPNFDLTKPVDQGVDALMVTPRYTNTKDEGKNGSEWLVSLEISQTIPEGANHPYAISLSIQGIVVSSPHLTGLTLQRSMHANGPAMLFGAAWEIIRAATGRGPWPAVIIPSTNFLTRLPPLQMPAIAEEVTTSKVRNSAAKRATSRTTIVK